MRKGTFAKAASLITIVAVLSLSAPGLLAAEKSKPFFQFKKFLKKPVVFLYSFIYFVPIYDIGKYINPPDLNTKRPNPKKIKISGVLDSVRPDDSD